MNTTINNDNQTGASPTTGSLVTPWDDPCLSEIPAEELEQAKTVCIEFLNLMKKTKRINKRANTYLLKHLVEKWYSGKTGESLYIPSPILNRAARDLGFLYQQIPDGIDLLLNVTLKTSFIRSI